MSIALTQAQVRELFDYGEENGVLIRKRTRAGNPWNKPCGNKPTAHGYGQVNIDGNMYLTHRIIWLWYYGTWPREIDHLDRNPMNNRIVNLRTASKAVNQHNRGIQRNNSSGYPGVCWNKQKKKYQAQIKINNKHIYLGCFTTPEDAFLAYQLAKIELHPTSPIAQEYLKELTVPFLLPKISPTEARFIHD